MADVDSLRVDPAIELYFLKHLRRSDSFESFFGAVGAYLRDEISLNALFTKVLGSLMASIFISITPTPHILPVFYDLDFSRIFLA
jgi:hypothetical protein